MSDAWFDNDVRPDLVKFLVAVREGRPDHWCSFDTIVRALARGLVRIDGDEYHLTDEGKRLLNDDAWNVKD